MKRMSMFLVVGLVIAGCGDDDESDASPAAAPTTEASAMEAPAVEAAARKGTKIKLGDSEFGSMLFGPTKQAIYIFQNDSNESACYGECAVAWPPVFTKGKPRAGAGVRASLLGTTKRRGGRRQVTYDGQPLYYYVNEGPGEVRCHNVYLNGGLWWVVGPNGRRRA